MSLFNPLRLQSIWPLANSSCIPLTIAPTAALDTVTNTGLLLTAFHNFVSVAITAFMVSLSEHTSDSVSAYSIPMKKPIPAPSFPVLPRYKDVCDTDLINYCRTYGMTADGPLVPMPYIPRR